MLGDVILFTDQPFTKRDYQRFGIDIFIDNNVNIYVWDFGFLFNKNRYNYDEDNSQSDFDNLTVFKNKYSATVALNSLCYKDIVIVHLPINYKSNFIFKIILKNSVYFGTLSSGLTPQPPINRSLDLLRFKNIISRFLSNPSVLVSDVINKIFLSFFNKSFDFKFLIICSRLAQKIHANTSSDLILSHQLDYDLFLQLKHKDDNVYLDTYAVFLDEYVPFHPDNYGREVAFCLEENYYNDLNCFFTYIENKFNIRVVIAAHPKSNNQKNSMVFNNRKVIYSNTHKLIKHSKLVLSHASTANNFSILFNKPIIFINSKKYSKYYQSTIDVFANELNKSSIDISSQYSLDLDIFFVDFQLYSNYKNKYIKFQNSPEENSWKIFINYLNRKFQNIS